MLSNEVKKMSCPRLRGWVAFGILDSGHWACDRCFKIVGSNPDSDGVLDQVFSLPCSRLISRRGKGPEIGNRGKVAALSALPAVTFGTARLLSKMNKWNYFANLVVTALNGYFKKFTFPWRPSVFYFSWLSSALGPSAIASHPSSTESLANKVRAHNVWFFKYSFLLLPLLVTVPFGPRLC